VSRDWRVYLDDIVEAADLVAEFTDGMTLEAFIADRRTYHAVLRNLEILGEAAKKLPVEVRERAPDVPWKQIAGFRDHLAHAYFELEDEVIWTVVRQHLPAFRAEADRLRNETDVPGEPSGGAEP
jgi:uncharacterized protein with HEPN domain